MLHSLCKAFHPDDYHHLGDELARVGHARNLFVGCHNFDHEHRAWEYSICLAAAGTRSDLAGKKCLDVGGSYSVLPGLLTWSGAHVTTSDIGDHQAQQEEMGRRALAGNGATPGGSLTYFDGSFPDGQFDLVTCVSVIEHVGEDRKFFDGLLVAVVPGGTLAITTDFHPTGTAKLTAHCQCYSAAKMLELIEQAKSDFKPVGSPDYGDYGTPIFGLYNFASLVLRRKA